MKAAELYEKLDSIHQLVKAHEDPDGNVLVDEVRVNVVLDFLDMEMQKALEKGSPKE